MKKITFSCTSVLTVDDITVKGNKGIPVVKQISFEVYENEIFGLAGVAGNGQRELVEAITGIRAIKTGRAALVQLNRQKTGYLS